MNETLHLPVLPLRNLVLFPGITVPIAAGRRITLKTLEAAQKLESPLVLAVAQHEDVDDVRPEGLHTVGTVARIEQVQRTLSGLQVLLHGEQRGVAVRYEAQGDDILEAVVRPADDMGPVDPSDPAFLALYREARKRAEELGQKTLPNAEAVRQVLGGIELPGNLADLVAGYLDISVAERQTLLETLSVEERLRRVLLHVQKQINVLDAQEDLKSKVQEELGGRQKEVYLREQMRAIQKELGEDDDDDLVELQEKIAALDLPESARQEVDRELRRLSRIGREAMEAQVIRTYLETIAELPWSNRSDERIDVDEASRILDEDHFGLADVKDRVLEVLAVRQLHLEKDQPGAEDEEGEDAPASRAPILLFVGPPGVGKTSLAKSIARSMGREYVRVSLGGARDEADIRGHRRTYVGAMPGRILQGMKQAGTRNPVFLLDEIDKLGASFHGDPSAALLEVLDPAQNETFVDHYLGVPFDLSEVLFVCTANFLQNIPGPLLDRMERVEFDGYTEQEKLEIARQYLVPRQLRNNSLDAEKLAIDDDAIREIVSSYTREAGVRQLEREIGRLGRKVARRIAARETEEARVGKREIRELLGRPRVRPEKMAARDQIGVATGMFYTPAGGDIMFVEATTMPGKGQLVLTGQLGDVMKESAQAAWSYARANAQALHLEPGSFESDLHIHVPAGAIPKDGPSAGITLATALISSLSGRPVRHDLAMTGEITLNGRVLPIGGVKEKLLGGVRAGIRTFVIPHENEADLEDLPDDVLEDIDVVPVRQLGEVLALALRGASFLKGRLLFGDEHWEDVAPLSSDLEH